VRASIDGLMLLLNAPFLFGWAKPVPVDWARLRNPRRDQIRVALAGPASNLVLALAFAALARLAPTTGFWAPLADMGYAGVMWNCALALFNLIPIPPLDGSWVLMYFLPLRHIIALHRFRLVGLALVVGVLGTPWIAGPVFHAPLRLAVSACLGLFGLAPQGQLG
jgi:Zn-dependent protease